MTTKRSRSNDDIKNPVLRTKRLHLVSDPGFLRRYFENLIVMATILFVGGSVPSLRELAIDCYGRINEVMMATAHRYAWWSLLGLLASSCCALQLLLNALSLGCAGFNTVLGPIRPTMLAATTLVQASSWCVAWNRPWQWKPTILSTMVVTGLAILPEVLDRIQNNKRQRKATKDSPKTRGLTRSDPSACQTIRYRLDNIGCSACVTTVSNVLEKLGVVESFDVSLAQGGVLSVTTTRDNDLATSQALVQSRLEDAGFPIQPLQEKKRL